MANWARRRRATWHRHPTIVDWWSCDSFGAACCIVGPAPGRSCGDTRCPRRGPLQPTASWSSWRSRRWTARSVGNWNWASNWNWHQRRSLRTGRCPGWVSSAPPTRAGNCAFDAGEPWRSLLQDKKNDQEQVELFNGHLVKQRTPLNTTALDWKKTASLEKLICYPEIMKTSGLSFFQHNQMIQGNFSSASSRP